MARWTTTITANESGTFRLVAIGGDFFELKVDGKTQASVWDLTEAATELVMADWNAGEQHEIELLYRPKFNDQGMQLGWITPLPKPKPATHSPKPQKPLPQPTPSSSLAAAITASTPKASTAAI